LRLRVEHIRVRHDLLCVAARVRLSVRRSTSPAVTGKGRHAEVASSELRQ
jgi:hypothetical protein